MKHDGDANMTRRQSTTLWDRPARPEVLEAIASRLAAESYLAGLLSQRRAIDQEIIIARNQLDEARQNVKAARRRK
jgi:hypothetical protein